LSFPTNDGVVGVAADRTLANLRLLQQRAQLAGASTLLLSSQPRDGLSAAQQAAIDAVDAGGRVSFGDCFVELRAQLANAQGGIAAEVSAGDGVHLNVEGHRRVQQQVLQVLNGGRCVRLGSPV
jgi:hypothetical protein